MSEYRGAHRPKQLRSILIALAVAVGAVSFVAVGNRGGLAVTVLPQPVASASPGDVAACDQPETTLGPNVDGERVLDIHNRCYVPGDQVIVSPWPSPVVTTTTVTVTPPPTSSSAPPATAPPPTTTPAPTTVPPTTPPATTPPPTTQPPAQLGCMPEPSRCGWPDATNTGVRPGVALTVVNGDVTLRTAGMVYEGKDVRGCISVRAKNITIRNVRVTCSTWYAIGVNTGTSGNIWDADDAGLVVEDTEINLGGSWEIKGIAFDGYTARRVHFYGGSDCAHMGANVLIEDSFCDIPKGGPADGPHYDGLQSDGGRNITIRHNTIRVPYGQTSAILMSTNTSPIRDVAIVDNLVAGGGYSIYCGTSTGGLVQGSLVYSGNRIARTYFSKGGYWGPSTYCPKGGAIWDDTGLPI